MINHTAMCTKTKHILKIAVMPHVCVYIRRVQVFIKFGAGTETIMSSVFTTRGARRWFSSLEPRSHTHEKNLFENKKIKKNRNRERTDSNNIMFFLSDFNYTMAN